MYPGQELGKLSFGAPSLVFTRFGCILGRLMYTTYRRGWGELD